MCRAGGWPQALVGSERVMLQQARDYLDSVTETDMSDVDGTRRDPALVRALLRSYARMSASQAEATEITTTIVASRQTQRDSVASGLYSDQSIRLEVIIRVF